MKSLPQIAILLFLLFVISACNKEKFSTDGCIEQYTNYFGTFGETVSIDSKYSGKLINGEEITFRRSTGHVDVRVEAICKGGSYTIFRVFDDFNGPKEMTLEADVGTKAISISLFMIERGGEPAEGSLCILEKKAADVKFMSICK